MIPRRRGYSLAITGGATMGALLKALFVIGRQTWTDWWGLMG